VRVGHHHFLTGMHPASLRLNDGELVLNLRLPDPGNPKKTRNLNFPSGDSWVDESSGAPLVRSPAGAIGQRREFASELRRRGAKQARLPRALLQSPSTGMGDYECPLCGGTGWKIVERDGLSAAERCECLGRDRTAELLEKARIPVNYRNDRFENFSDRGSPELRMILTLLLRYCEEFPHADPPGLLLAGEPGTGKTHLAVAVLKRLIENGFPGVFMDYQMLLERIRASYDPLSGESPREAYETALEAEVLLLDDLGAHRVTDWVEDTVTSIITHRCNQRRPLIATTNLPDPEMGGALAERIPEGAGSRYDIRTTLVDRIGIRARSRLFEMCRVVRMPKVGDYRIAMRRQG